MNLISGNTFGDYALGVAFFDSEWDTAATTSVAHEQIGADNVVIDGNTFVGASGYNVFAWPDSDADLMQVTNNEMTCNTCIHVRIADDTSVVFWTISSNTFNGGNWGVYTDDTEYVGVSETHSTTSLTSPSEHRWRCRC